MNKKMLKHETPNMIVILLGLILSFLAEWYLALLYGIIIIVSVLWMGRFICTHCMGFGNENCPSIYGEIASKLFKKAEIPDFDNVYRKNLFVILLEWIYPVIIGIIYIIIDFSWILLIVTVIFMLISFVWLPKKSQKDCMDCDNEDCPHKKSIKKKLKISPI